MSPTTSLQATPILVDERSSSARRPQQVIALDAETGAERWRFDPEVEARGRLQPGLSRRRPRIVAPTRHAAGAPRACASRIFFGTIDARLIALDAATGCPARTSAAAARSASSTASATTRPGEYTMTSPPLVVGDLVVTGAWVTDNQRVDAPGGVVRAYDARTGALVWAWDPVPDGAIPSARRLAAGGAYARGTANAWSILSADAERDLVFVPTGNAAPDYYGGERLGLDAYSNSVVALDAKTGERAGTSRPCTTISGTTTSRRSPSSRASASAPGEIARRSPRPRRWATSSCSIARPASRSSRSRSGRCRRAASPRRVRRPDPALPVAARRRSSPTRSRRRRLGPHAVDRAMPQDRRRAAQRGHLHAARRAGHGRLPGHRRRRNWGGVSIDPGAGARRQHDAHPFIVSSSRAPSRRARRHGPRRSPPQEGTPYAMRRAPLLSSLGHAVHAAAVGHADRDRPRDRRDPLAGPARQSARARPRLRPVLHLGTPNQGGPIETAGGLVFIGATMDRTFRAFDAETGEVLWSTLLRPPPTRRR